jgi:hypothetical protein
MSDANHECAVVSRELHDLEKREDIHVEHAGLVVCGAQGAKGRSGRWRFCDPFYQGMIDRLFIGRWVEAEWLECIDEIATKYRDDPRLSVV